MVTLPRLTDYAPTDLARIAGQSPAFAHYGRLLETPTLDPLFAKRHRAWMVCAAATLARGAPAADVCAYWSDVADEILIEAWRQAGLGDLPALLVTLGKHGARELNLSSDVDLMVLAEDHAVGAVTRALRVFQRRLADPDQGLCFRLDFDLRPGGGQGPLVPTPGQFQDHYWSHGETWERLAMVRLRTLTGPRSLAQRIEDLARRYSYRKYLDYALLEDLKSLRAAVHQRGFTRRPGEVHLKLEVGGIRDIELFVHAHQVLNGGKQPAVQSRSTSDALARLAEHGLLDADVAAALDHAYWTLREVENHVQAIDDRQTHVLSDSDPRGGVVRATMADVDRRVSSLLGRVDLSHARLPLGPTEQGAWLKALGFSEDTIRDDWPRLFSATALGQKNDRDERARREFLYAFVTALARQSGFDRDLGLRLLADFVRATRAKATFFSTLLRTPDLIEDLARLFCLSPYTGALLAARPELLDQLILPVAFAWADDPDRLLSQMAERRQLTDLWAANHLLARGDLKTLFTQTTDVADQIAQHLLRSLRTEFAGTDVRVLALGKWGGRELGLRSDLDFIFITARPPGAADFRLARRFITRLTNPGKDGALYDVDLRLRPSGQSGPLMVTSDQLETYWRTEAKPWERQAYLRARALDGPPPDRAQLVARPLTAADLDELKRIRARLLRSPEPHAFDLKFAPGGLVDTEFVAQTALLIQGFVDAPTDTLGMIEALGQRDPAWARAAAGLTDAYRELRLIEQHLQLASSHRLGPLGPKDQSLARAAAGLGLEPGTLWSRLHELTRQTRERLNDLDPTGLKI